ncbi:MAG: phasin family protein [Desulfatiglandales bacterium]
MFELIRKSLLASLGAAVVTKEKVEAATKKWVDDGKISTEEAEKFAQDLVDSGQKQWDEFQVKIADTVKKTLESLNVATHTDIEALYARIEAIEKKLSLSQDPGKSGLEES